MARYCISKYAIVSPLTSARRACQSWKFRWIFFIPPLSSSPFFVILPLVRLVSTAGALNVLKLKTLEIDHSRQLFIPSFSVGCLVKKAGPRKKGQSFQCRMPFKLFIRISRSWGRRTRSVERTRDKPATRNAENHVHTSEERERKSHCRDSMNRDDQSSKDPSRDLV